MKISSHVFADVLNARPATKLRAIEFGRLVLVWDTQQPYPDRKPGARAAS